MCGIVLVSSIGQLEMQKININDYTNLTTISHQPHQVFWGLFVMKFFLKNKYFNPKDFKESLCAEQVASFLFATL